MTELQCTEVTCNGPAIVRLDPAGIGIHHAVAVRDHVVKMPYRSVSQTVDMKRWRLRKSALHDHAVAAAGPVVTFGTDRFKSFPSSRQQLRGEFHRRLRHVNAVC